jgi:hypothetical protein
MKSIRAGYFILFLVLLTGFELTLSAQCVSEDNVFTFSYNGKNYEVIKETKTWADAASCAVERGGYLVEINSQDEQDTVYGSIIHGAMVSTDYTTVMDGGGIAYVWIGASDVHSEGVWLWDGNGDNDGINFWNGQGLAGANDGSVVGEHYNNWGGTSRGAPNEPDDFGSGQDGAAIGLANWPSGFPDEQALGIASEWNDISDGNNLFFVVEFDCKETMSTLDSTACDSYISPSGKIWNEAGTYVDTIGNTAGCDSIITINLDFHVIDTSVTQDGVMLTANSAGALYQWLDCSNGGSIIDGETGQSFMVTSDGSYAVEIMINGCMDTSSCHTVTTTAIFNRVSEEQILVFQGSDNRTVYVDMRDMYQNIILQVSDLNGRTIRKERYPQARKMKFTLEEPPGIYFITLVYDQHNSVVKIRLD